MTIKATFIGKNGSLGFETGKEYELITHINPLNIDSSILVNDKFDGSKVCAYSNVFKFFENWNNIQTTIEQV